MTDYRNDDSDTAWEKTKEASSDAWEKTKEVSSDAWEKTKEVSSKAWEATKNAASDAKDYFSGDDDTDDDYEAVEEIDETDDIYFNPENDLYQKRRDRTTDRHDSL